MTGFFYMCVLTAIGLGFIGFQLIAACDRLGFAGIDFFGMALLLFCGPLLIMSLNLLSGGRETFKFLGAALTTFFLFLFFNAGAMHSIIGAGGFMNPLYSLVTLLFMIIIFLTAGMAVWNFARGRILETSRLPWLALAMTVALFIGAWAGQWRFEEKRNSWYGEFATSGTMALKPETSIPKQVGMEFGAQLTFPVGLPPQSVFSEEAWSDFEAEASAVAASGARYAIIRSYFRCFAGVTVEAPAESDIARDARVTGAIRARGLGLVLLDTPMTIPGEGGARRTFADFSSAHALASAMVARRHTPDLFVITGEPHPGIMVGITGEVTREEWGGHVRKVARSIREASPGTKLASAISLETLVSQFGVSPGDKAVTGMNASTGITASNSAEPLPDDADWMSDGPEASGGISDPCLATALSDPIDFGAIRIFFREHVDKLREAVSAAGARMPCSRLAIIETWNGWALSGPRSDARDAMWVKGISGLARSSGFALTGFTPFGNFFKGRYYNDFGTPGRPAEISAAFKAVGDEIGSFGSETGESK